MQGLCASNTECAIPFGDLVQFKLHQHCRATTAMTAVSSEEETRPAVHADKSCTNGFDLYQ